MGSRAEVDEITALVNGGHPFAVDLVLDGLDFKGVVLKQIQGLLLGNVQLLEREVLLGQLAHFLLYFNVMVRGDAAVPVVAVVKEPV